MLTWHVLLFESKWGCESGGHWKRCSHPPVIIHGVVGNAQFGGLEWGEPHVLLGALYQSRN